MLEVSLTKRKALYKDEIGLFGCDAVADEELSRLKIDEVCWAEITTPKSIELLRFLWSVAQKLSDGGLFESKDDAMLELKIKARFAKFVVEGNRVVIVPKSLAKQRRDVLSRLADRFVFLVCRDYLPHMAESEFRREIEAMVS